jgi:hypothetical protein
MIGSLCQPGIADNDDPGCMESLHTQRLPCRQQRQVVLAWLERRNHQQELQRLGPVRCRRVLRVPMSKNDFHHPVGM